jgi:hypothetical protein
MEFCFMFTIFENKKEMKITDSKKLLDIKKEFSEKFPYLKLEFYAKEHKEGEGSGANLKIDGDLTIGAVRSSHEEGDLSIDGHLKVSTFERMFFEKYGLNVQVFRKSGTIWLQTIKTDDWTLAEQNSRGKKSVTQEF